MVEKYKGGVDREFKNAIRFEITEGPIFQEWRSACIKFMNQLVDRVHRIFPQLTVKEIYSAIKDVSMAWNIDGPDGEKYPGLVILIVDEEQEKIIREALKECGTSVHRRRKQPTDHDRA
jgi:hypothetical protein